MGIRAYCGEIGSGKSYVGCWNAQIALRLGRPVCASYAIHGCRYLLTLAAGFSDRYRGSYFVFDEAGGKLSSRRTDETDKASMLVLQQIRHNLIDLDLLYQHPRQLDIAARELIQEYVFLKRVGPSGELEARGAKPSWRTHPWLIIGWKYRPEHFDDNWHTKPGVKPSLAVWPWRRSCANLYNSWDRVVQESDVALIEEARRAAETHWDLPTAVVVGGKVVPQILPAGYQLLMPPKAALRGKGGSVEALPAHPSFMASLGLYRHEDGPPAESALVVEREPEIVDDQAVDIRLDELDVICEPIFGEVVLRRVVPGGVVVGLRQPGQVPIVAVLPPTAPALGRWVHAVAVVRRSDGALLSLTTEAVA